MERWQGAFPATGPVRCAVRDAVHAGGLVVARAPAPLVECGRRKASGQNGIRYKVGCCHRPFKDTQRGSRKPNLRRMTGVSFKSRFVEKSAQSCVFVDGSSLTVECQSTQLVDNFCTPEG